ncbi:MAG TPA: PA2169 family four-helix-bundle protein [Paludibacter sp.]|nr:PA2169 family four-helix-bundle protein [Paludibacter sp.]
METLKTIDVLNKLVEINNDRIEGYETAAKETDETELETMFLQFAHTSRKCREGLSREIMRLGGTPTEGTKVSGKFFRAWMDVKAAITGKDRKAILESCEFGEDNAADTYEDVLKDNREYLTEEQRTMVSSQYAMIKADHFRVKTMRDSLTTV